MSIWNDILKVFRPAPPQAPAIEVEPPEPAPAPIAVVRFTPAGPPPMSDLTAEEKQMHAAIQRGDASGRAIYGDWLETQGRHPEAEYVRAELAVQAAAPEALKDALDRYHFAARRVATGFKALLSRPAIEKCLSFQLQCPKQWSALELTDDPQIRNCGACQKQVTFCPTVQEAKALAADGHCVAVDLSQTRHPRDLDPPQQFVRMGLVAPRYEGD